MFSEFIQGMNRIGSPPISTSVALEYISTLSPLEIQVMEIAKQDLEKSFDIRKSIGFISWLKKKEI